MSHHESPCDDAASIEEALKAARVVQSRRLASRPPHRHKPVQSANSAHSQAIANNLPRQERGTSANSVNVTESHPISATMHADEPSDDAFDSPTAPAQSPVRSGRSWPIFDGRNSDNASAQSSASQSELNRQDTSSAARMVTEAESGAVVDVPAARELKDRPNLWNRRSAFCPVNLA